MDQDWENTVKKIMHDKLNFNSPLFDFLSYLQTVINPMFLKILIS